MKIFLPQTIVFILEEFIFQNALKSLVKHSVYVLCKRNQKWVKV